MSEQSIEIMVNLRERGYPIFVGNQIVSQLPELLTRFKINRQIAIISTPPVSQLYLNKIKDSLSAAWEVKTFDVPDGEISKSGKIVDKLYTWLIENRFERNSTILALGGGVVGDLAGFVAASYLRGINLVQIPTTLLAQVDSSIGGKVGINHTLGKNLIGAFYQPKMVVADISFLKSLPDEEFVCGMGEVVKYGVLSESDLFIRLESNLEKILYREPDLLMEIISSCARIKAEIVEDDEREQGIRAHLNLGHTFAHALETYFSYEGLKHGQAVLLGMKSALHVSQEQDIIEEDVAMRIGELINKFDVEIPTTKRLNPEELVSIMKRDKKIRQGKINLVLPEGIGKISVKPVSDEKLLADSFSVLL